MRRTCTSRGSDQVRSLTRNGSSDEAISLSADRRGVVYVEFLLVFPPLFLLFLVILQTAILYATDLGVSHAASATVRSAIVVLPDDPIAYDGQPLNLITESSECSEGFAGRMHKLLGKLGVNSLSVPDDGKCLGGARMEAIRFAAIMRMLPFSPNASTFLPRKLRGVLNTLGQVGWITGAAAYSYGATSVSFPLVAGSEKLRPFNVFTDDEPVTVRVSYLAHCGIPIARFLMCDSSHRLALGFGVDKERVAVAKTLAKGSGSPTILLGLIASGERFRILRADATLPLNGANYSFQKKED